MRKKIFRSMCGVALLCVLLACLCTTGVLYKFSYDNMRSMIRDETIYVVASLNSGDRTPLEATRATFTRITLVDPDGTVVFDSVEDPAGMDNHADRPEIVRALENGAAEINRFSDTFTTQIYYRAVRLQNGQVVRVSGELRSVWSAVWGYIPYIVLALLIGVAASAFSASILANRIATPLNSINLDDPLSNDIYEELSPMLRRMEQQRGKISEQLDAIAQQRREFAAITDNMREGLVLLGHEAEVLAINHSALEILGLAAADCIGKHILHIGRGEDWRTVVEKGLGGRAAEVLLPMRGREYQLLVNPVTTSGMVQGAVLLLLDVTERRQAEQMRQEFTANVSHELKTPLTSISGFAELIKDGLAKPEDIARFGERIHSESRRLVALVDDILRLSRLEERGGLFGAGPVNLLELGRTVAERLEPLAGERQVRVTVSGDSAVVMGDAQILEEMAGNLIDNAIKYNRPGGRVDVTVRANADGAVLEVRDTGIGIPVEHHGRIFERFYRVDKSHSKETGGTGLGLSIVKHGAKVHGAKVELQSTENEGTCITIRFPGGYPAP